MRRQSPARALVLLVILAAPFAAAEEAEPEVSSVGAVVARLPEPIGGAGHVWTGERVILLGGYGVDGPSDGILSFDPATGNTSRAEARLPSPRYLAPALWTGERVLLFGGLGKGGAYLDEIIAYDPRAGTVEVVARLPESLAGAAAAWDPRDRPDEGCAGGCAFVLGGRAAGGMRDGIVSVAAATGEVRVAGGRLPFPCAYGGAAWTGADVILTGCLSQDANGKRQCREATIVSFLPAESRAYVRGLQFGLHHHAGFAHDARTTHVVGGVTCSGEPVNVVSEVSYHGGGSRWESLPSTRFSSAVASVDGALLVLGGFTGSSAGPKPIDDVVRVPAVREDPIEGARGPELVVDRIRAPSDGVDGAAHDPALSADGSVLAFVSSDPNASAPHPWAGRLHVGEGRGEPRVVTLSLGNVATAFRVGHPAVSGDGRFVAVLAVSDDESPNASAPPVEVLVHDLREGRTEWVAIAAAAGEAFDARDFRPSLNRNGSLVAFTSTQSLVAGDENGVADVHVLDRATGALTRASIASGGAEAGAASDSAALAPDGRFVAFASDASDLVADDANGHRDIFARDLVDGITWRVSVPDDGRDADGPSRRPAVGGHVVAFESDAANLVAGDANGVTDVFARHALAGGMVRMSVGHDGREGDGPSTSPAVAVNGRIVVFVSEAKRLAAGDADATADVVARDLASNATVLLGRARTRYADAPAAAPAVSSDAHRIAFHSTSARLDERDSDALLDVFVHERPQWPRPPAVPFGGPPRPHLVEQVVEPAEPDLLPVPAPGVAAALVAAAAALRRKARSPQFPQTESE